MTFHRTSSRSFWQWLQSLVEGAGLVRGGSAPTTSTQRDRVARRGRWKRAQFDVACARSPAVDDYLRAQESVAQRLDRAIPRNGAPASRAVRAQRPLLRAVRRN